MEQMRKYDLWNNALGWMVFGIAAFTYLSTVEPTASFWDCPEFISCAAKGEVGHPPGNAFFNLTGRFFANFAGGDMEQVAVWINRMSALLSAGTVLFLFWTITAMTRKLTDNAIVILASGVVGALAFAWSDTFWFSAVEAEVYAFSSFMTAVVFWLILKWERRAESIGSDRYILLIAYVVGLSIGVHLLNLLSIPAIVLVCFFKKSKRPTAWRTVGVLVLSFVLVGAILYGVIPGLLWLAGRVELLFVNVLGLPYNSGSLVCLLLVLAALCVALWQIYRGKMFPRRPRLASNVILCLLLIIVGFSTFVHVIIRASAGLPMNENNPDDVFALTRYLGREQYGDTPLLWGRTFASSPARNVDGAVVAKEGAAVYSKVVKKDTTEPDRYEVTGHKADISYDYEMLFPRMYSNMPNHVQGYKEWSGFEGKTVVRDGKSITVPTFADNLRYFLRYQVGFMYWRYFLWNFAGRQSDEQSQGEADRGNWITGFPFIDRWIVGSAETPRFIEENAGHNVFYAMPLVLGLIGLLWQTRRGREGARGSLIVGMLFFMTGLAIVLYLNQPPYQVRERDYAYVGSFYAFAIWIGMGVVGLAEVSLRSLRSLKSLKTLESLMISLAISALCLAVPLQMLSQTWDDHDRSGRYTARDFGRNYLSSLAPNAIILTDGDNETFPLWYAQDVEGFRTDVRVCNLSYLQTDWYIRQMQSPMHDSAPLPIALRPDQYNADRLDIAYIVPLVEDELPLDTALQFLCSDDPQYHTLLGHASIDYLPAAKLSLDSMHIDLSGHSYITKERIALLSMLNQIANDGWQRPIYISAATGRDKFFNSLDRYRHLTGLAYQIRPDEGGLEACDIEQAYDNMMHRFRWGNIADPHVYLDENNRRMCQTHRRMFCRLIKALLDSGDKDRALKAVRYCDANIPSAKIPYDLWSLPLAEAFFACGEKKDGERILQETIANATDYLDWATNLSPNKMRTVAVEIYDNILALHTALEIAENNGLTSLANKNIDRLNRYIAIYSTIK